MSERAFPFIRMNVREGKPRTRGITEIRGPYYTPMGKRYLEDVLETMGEYVDSLKFAAGSFILMPEKQLKEINSALRQMPRDMGLGGNLWDGKTLAAWIAQRYKIDLGVRQCQRLFRQLGFRLRKPRPRIAQADPVRQKAHKKNSKR